MFKFYNNFHLHTISYYLLYVTTIISNYFVSFFYNCKFREVQINKEKWAIMIDPRGRGGAALNERVLLVHSLSEK